MSTQNCKIGFAGSLLLLLALVGVGELINEHVDTLS